MKKINLILIIIFNLVSLSAQKIIDVQIDKIFIDDDEVIFVNEGELNTYTCDLRPLKLRDFEHLLILDCDDYNNWQKKRNPKLLDFNELSLISEPQEFLDLIKHKKFTAATNKENHERNSYLQYYNDQLMTELIYRNYNVDNPDWRFYRAEFWRYVFLRINKKHLLIAIVDEDYADISLFIIPKKDEIIFVSEYQFKVEGSSIDTVDLSQAMILTDFYRSKKTEHGYMVFDKLFQDTIIHKVFDQIEFTKDIILCQDQNETSIYNDKWNVTIDTSSIIVGYPYNNSIQCIKNNKSQWLDSNGKFQDTLSSPSIGFCGTIRSTERKIHKSLDSIYEFNESGYFGQREQSDSTLFSPSDSTTSILYLNNKTEHSFDEYSDLNKVFSFPYTTYLLINNGSKTLVSIKNKRDSLEQLLTLEKYQYYQNQEKTDSLDNVMSNLKDDISIEVLFKGNIEPLGYHHPVKFKEGNLYGYFPQNKTAKYKVVSEFNFYFAEFELENGQTGWLDIYGNEHYNKETKAHNMR